MAADPSLVVRRSHGSAPKPAPAKAHRPVSFAECLVQELPKLPSLAALRALTDRELPSTDGVPMPESMVQGPPLRYTVDALGWWFAERRPGTCVAGDLLVYDEGVVEADGGVRARSIAPDVLVAFGVGERLRDSYVMWQEGKAPDFVLEIASESTWRRDRDEKPARYAALGVGEYFLYDPEGGRLEPRLQGYVLEAGAYRRLPGERLGNGAWGGEESGAGAVRVAAGATRGAAVARPAHGAGSGGLRRGPGPCRRGGHRAQDGRSTCRQGGCRSRRRGHRAQGGRDGDCRAAGAAPAVAALTSSDRVPCSGT